MRRAFQERPLVRSVDRHCQDWGVIEGIGGPAARGVVSSLPRGETGLGEMSLLVSRLLRMDSWADRLLLLRSHPALVHQAVAGRCRMEGADELAGFLGRAASVGLDRALPELDVLISLEHLAEDDPSSAIVLLEQAGALIEDGAGWILPELLRCAEAVGQRHPELSNDLREAGINALASATATRPSAIKNLLALACMEWDEVWSLLEPLISRNDMMDAFPAALAVAALSADLPQLGEWIAELQGLLEAAGARGPQVAQEEHQLRLLAQSFAAGEELEQFENPAAGCAQLAGEIALHVQRTGAVWMIPEAVAVARAAVERTDPESPLLGGRLSNLSGLIVEGIQAGVYPVGAMPEALQTARDAFAVGSPEPTVRARLAANLGNRISQAVDAGLCSTSDLIEAVRLHRQAWELTPPDGPERSRRASNLSALLADAFEAGLLSEEHFLKSLELQNQAVKAAEPDGADLPWYLSNRANRTAQAVRYSILPPESLLDGIDDLKRSTAISNPSHPAYAGTLSNLSSLLSEAIHAGVLSRTHLPEAIALAEEALDLTPHTSPDWCNYANNLATRLGAGVAMGIETVDRLAAAVELAQQALDATPDNHRARASRMSTLVGRVLAAVDAGVAAPESLKPVVGLGESMWLMTPPGHPLRAKLANDVAILMSEAVKLGFLEPMRLIEAVEIATEGLELTQPGHPDWPEAASNLGAILAEGIHHGVLPESRLVEAVSKARAAYEHASTAPVRAGLATNASALIAEAIAAGALGSEYLGEALELQLEALELVPFPHPDRPSYASNAIQRLADAFARSLASSDDVLERVNHLVGETWVQATRSIAPIQRRRVLELSSRLAKYAPLLLLRITGDPIEAAMAIEHLRGHLLRGMRAQHLRPGVVSPELEARYAAVAADYEQSQLHVIDGIGTFGQARSAYDALVESVDQVMAEAPEAALGLPPSRAGLLHAVSTDTAFIYLVAGLETSLSQYPGAAIILGQNACSAVSLPGLTQESVAANVEKVMDPEASMDEVCSWLGEAVLSPLLAAAESADSPLVAGTWKMVPTGLIGMLPLHAAGMPTRALDDIRETHVIRSALPAESCHAGVLSARGRPVAMALKSDDLAFPAADVAVARALVTDCNVLREETPRELLMAALAEAPVAVLSGHAVHALDVGGSLQLGAPESRLWLTSDDVVRLPFRQRDLAILAACSSGQPALSLPEEAVGLPTALLSAGFNSVLATLWPVRDSVAFVTIARFLQLRRAAPNLGASLHLRATRCWLREVSCAELRVWLSDLEDDVDLDPATIGILHAEWASYPDLAEPFPYADPRDWAAFFCVGANAPHPWRS